MKVLWRKLSTLNWCQLLASNWCHTLTSGHLCNQTLFSTIFSPNFFTSGSFLDTFLTSYWHRVLMSIWYLRYDFNRMSKSGLLMLCYDIDQIYTSIWGSGAHWVMFNVVCFVSISDIIWECVNLTGIFTIQFCNSHILATPLSKSFKKIRQ